MKRPALVIFSGLPGVGKTTIAKALAANVNAFYLRIDTIEQALVRSSLNIIDTGDAGYEVAYAVAADHLRLNHIVVADSVNCIAVTQEAWRNVAQKNNATAIDIEVICSDTDEHRRRVETRIADIEDHVLPTWDDILERQYEPRHDERIVLDTFIMNLDKCVQKIIKNLQQPRGL